MRYSLTASLLLLAVLFAGIACHDKVDVDIEPVITQPVPACRIVKTAYKTIYISGPKVGYEKLMAGNKSYDLYTWVEYKYTYDADGRVIKQESFTWGGYSTVVYMYTATKLYTRRVNASKDGLDTQIVLDTIPLNRHGFDDRSIFDEQGHVMLYKGVKNMEPSRWVDNNKTYSMMPLEAGKIYRVATYDLTRLALPYIFQFEGVGSKNLVSSITTNASGSPFYKEGPVYKQDFIYTYDTNGRVVRQVQVDTEYSGSNWQFAENPGLIGVYDYEYSCQ
ncbi:hypothetical protein [Fibrella aquatilis]|uniref:DUF4595 domain-containing protein n=1 Tax=Fibrella aquatilis TaxID=2817059 RepID=A0A939G8C8_9BACT|nr:hypothetical protein [Fibrella aquatilis]MBO0932027.1 hypothetical protein [Fibrella aquatilis]